MFSHHPIKVHYAANFIMLAIAILQDTTVTGSESLILKYRGYLGGFSVEPNIMAGHPSSSL